MVKRIWLCFASDKLSTKLVSAFALKKTKKNITTLTTIEAGGSCVIIYTHSCLLNHVTCSASTTSFYCLAVFLNLFSDFVRCTVFWLHEANCLLPHERSYLIFLDRQRQQVLFCDNKESPLVL